MRRRSNPPDWHLEDAAAVGGHVPVAGIDEAGRGPWAGPVVAAAAILDANNFPDGLDDSKKLSSQRREVLFDEIRTTARAFAIVSADVGRIDRDNILNATLWAMSEAARRLETRPVLALVDGNRLPPLQCRAQAVVRGDAQSLSIAAASILAKVARDRIMAELALAHPQYGWERNKGYGTAEHADALQRFGITEHHRLSFKPVAALQVQAEG